MILKICIGVVAFAAGIYLGVLGASVLISHNLPAKYKCVLQETQI